jgi:hypothetical protein
MPVGEGSAVALAVGCGEYTVYEVRPTLLLQNKVYTVAPPPHTQLLAVVCCGVWGRR